MAKLRPPRDARPDAHGDVRLKSSARAIMAVGDFLARDS